MLTPGNTKLGNIHNWSIPAIKTCPGRSSFCESICYATNGRYRANNVQAAHARNLELCKTAGWTSDMIDEINKKPLSTVRIHAAGDFYDLPYIRKWHTIVKACPDTKFYAYTRSWNRAGLLEGLTKLASESNFEMWWSWDHDMPDPPDITGIRICYLMRDDQDAPPRPVDLVFRDTPPKSSVMKRVNDSLVCPYEQNVRNSAGDKPKMSCESCGICFSSVHRVRAIGVVN